MPHLILWVLLSQETFLLVQSPAAGPSFPTSVYYPSFWLCPRSVPDAPVPSVQFFKYVDISSAWTGFCFWPWLLRSPGYSCVDHCFDFLPSTRPSVHPSTHLSTHPPTHPSNDPCLHPPPTCPSVTHPPIRPPIRPPTHPSVIHPSTFLLLSIHTSIWCNGFLFQGCMGISVRATFNRRQMRIVIASPGECCGASRRTG